MLKLMAEFALTSSAFEEMKFAAQQRQNVTAISWIGRRQQNLTLRGFSRFYQVKAVADSICRALRQIDNFERPCAEQYRRYPGRGWSFNSVRVEKALDLTRSDKVPLLDFMTVTYRAHGVGNAGFAV